VIESIAASRAQTVARGIPAQLAIKALAAVLAIAFRARIRLLSDLVAEGCSIKSYFSFAHFFSPTWTIIQARVCVSTF
jgi:hypothetical protein